MSVTPLDFGSWLSSGASQFVPTQVALRAQVEWSRIQDKATDIQINRNGTLLDPQTVRIEYDDTFANAVSDLGNSTLRKVMVFGIHGHPEIDDTDIKVWDTFIMDDLEYTVVSVNRHVLGQVQAYCEAVG